MTLTVVVGSSGSGKTTFLNDVHKAHNCIYIRQYHNIRPYVVVKDIPNFDPTQLPYWELYEKEDKADTIRVGGTMAGEFTSGLSGGQRKLLLFELIRQRVQYQTNSLLVILDEPFAGVTDDFVPFVTARLDEMRQRHNVLLVTNDHVDALMSMADNTLRVSAIDRTRVQINNWEGVDRSKAILALSSGDAYEHDASMQDVWFFLSSEIFKNSPLFGIAIFTIVNFALFIGCFWDSRTENMALVLLAGSIIAFFAINPYLLALVDWRNYMLEEAEALLHSSKGLNQLFKTLLIAAMILMVSALQFGTTVVIVDGADSFQYFWAMFLDSLSMTAPLIFAGVYTTLPFATVDMIGLLPFLFLINFSTTLSPGSGVPVLKELRYAFSRFYWWCMVPVVEDSMEGCPSTTASNMLYMTLSSLIGLVLFIVVMVVVKFVQKQQQKKANSKMNDLKDDEFRRLQNELYKSKTVPERSTDLES